MMILSNAGAAGHVKCAGQGAVITLADRLNKHASHAAAGASYRDPVPAGITQDFRTHCFGLSSGG